jgi:bacteriochlorophyll 4-vinyl reductase
MRFVTFQELKASLLRVFGPSASAIVYDAGIEPGRSSCIRLLKACKTKQEALTVLTRRKASQNWGALAFDDLDWKEHSGKVVVANSFESRGMQSKEPSCHFFKGYLTGFLSELFQDEVAMSENRCRAIGHSRCEFTFR